MNGTAGLGAECVVRRPLNVRMRNVNGTTMVAGYRHVLELSEVAAYAWLQIDGRRTLGEIAAIVAGEYDVDPETATRDVTELFANLIEHDVLELRTSGG